MESYTYEECKSDQYSSLLKIDEAQSVAAQRSAARD
jgi:hypothetical protein